MSRSQTLTWLQQKRGGSCATAVSISGSSLQGAIRTLTWFQNTVDFSQAAGDVGHVSKAVPHRSCVEGVRVERKGEGVAFDPSAGSKGALYQVAPLTAGITKTMKKGKPNKVLKLGLRRPHCLLQADLKHEHDETRGACSCGRIKRGLEEN